MDEVFGTHSWKTFLRNHADGIASIDMFVVPTISFRQLYGLLVLRHSRRELLWLGVTAHPSEPPRYIIRDLDGAYGGTFIRRLRAKAPIGVGSSEAANAAAAAQPTAAADKGFLRLAAPGLKIAAMANTSNRGTCAPSAIIQQERRAGDLSML